MNEQTFSPELRKAFEEFVEKLRLHQIKWGSYSGAGDPEVLKFDPKFDPKFVVFGRGYGFHGETLWLIDQEGKFRKHSFTARRGGTFDTFSKVLDNETTLEECLAAFVSDSSVNNTWKGEHRRMTEKEMLLSLKKMTSGILLVPHGFFDSCEYWGFFRP